MPNITVNSASQITAAEWASLLKKSPYVPEFVKRGISAKGNTINGPGKISQPKDKIPVDWIEDLAAAFASEAWEITTAHETFEVVAQSGQHEVRRRVVPDLGQSEFGPGYWLTVGPGQREWSPDTRYIHSTYKVGDIAVLFGETFSSARVNKQAKKDERAAESRLSSGRALIILVNRVTVYNVKSFTGLAARFVPEVIQSLGHGQSEAIPFSPIALIYTFLHEVAAHAGRMNQGKTSVHGAPVVDQSVDEIKALFPGNPENIHMRQITDAVRAASTRLVGIQAQRFIREMLSGVRRR